MFDPILEYSYDNSMLDRKKDFVEIRVLALTTATIYRYSLFHSARFIQLILEPNEDASEPITS